MTIKGNYKRLTVLHVATLNQPIKSDLGYGPIETVIYNIDKGLHSLGHRSIVACSGDSGVAGEHCVTIEKSIGDYWNEDTPERRRTLNTHLSMALDRARRGGIDVIHTHDLKTVEYICDALPGLHVPIVMTLHVAAKDYWAEGTYRYQRNPMSSPLVHCVPISGYQKREYTGLKTEDVVYHGIEVEQSPVEKDTGKKDYLFTIGRVTPDKGQDKAIETARKTGSKLIIAGCVQDKAADREFFAGLKGSIDLFVDVAGPVDDDYYGRVIKPLLDRDSQIIYIGEISSEHKRQWYRHARATLFPIQWGEPFGLVMIESMACGTPAIAFNKGAVPEIVVDGKTGFVVDSLDAMIEAVGRTDGIDPHECRRHVQDNFSIASMACQYSELYQRIAIGHKVSESYSPLLIDYFPIPLNHVGAAAPRNPCPKTSR